MKVLGFIFIVFITLALIARLLDVVTERDKWEDVDDDFEPGKFD